jgi:hypothetical protein
MRVNIKLRVWFEHHICLCSNHYRACFLKIECFKNSDLFFFALGGGLLIPLHTFSWYNKILVTAFWKCVCVVNKKLLWKKKLDLWEKNWTSTQKHYFFRCSKKIFKNLHACVWTSHANVSFSHVRIIRKTNNLETF